MINKCFVKIIGAVLCAALFVTGAGINVKAAGAKSVATDQSTSSDAATSSSSADKNAISDSTVSKTTSTNKLTVSASERPDLPLIQITTEDGALPTYEVVNAPSGLAGATITDAEYVSGNMTISGSGAAAGQYEMKFKVRGNTSAVEKEKKSYKIKLSAKADLLGRGSAYADKTWILLNTGTNLNTYIGDIVSRKVGMEWTPSMTFVNVEINGDWQGLYILTEAVEEGSSRVNISNSGYLFENDAYWWNEDVYFRTSGQAQYLAYTLKYPEVKSSSDSKVASLKSLMQKVENYTNSGSSSLWSIVDATSWSSWLLARDILGQGDPSGSNIYFYKYSSASTDLIKMGPLWDFDSAFMHTSSWSEQHDVTYLPYNQLLKNETFANAYIAKWNEVSASLQADIFAQLDSLKASYGAAINKSRQLDKKRWGGAYVSIENEIATDKAYFTTHLAWMNEQITSGNLTTTFEENQSTEASTADSSAAGASATSADSASSASTTQK